MPWYDMSQWLLKPMTPLMSSAMWKVQNALGSAFASDGLYDPEAKDEIDDGDAVSSNTPADFVVEIAAGG